LTYQWFFGDGTSSTNINPVHAYNTAGNFTVTLVAQNEDGCTNTYKQIITVGTAKVDFTYTGGCIGEPVVFKDASSTVPISETWNFGDGATAAGDSVLHTYAGAGSFYVTLVADFGGCTNTIKKQITTGAKPKAAFYITGDAKTCSYPVKIRFTNQSVGAENYQWLFGDGTTSDSINPEHIYNNAGDYSVTLIAFNKNGCGDTLIRTNLIQLGPPKILGIEDIPYEGCIPKTLTFRPILIAPDPVTSYKWNFGDGGTSTDSVPKHTYSKVGIYTVTLTISTGKGCTDSLTIINAVSLGKKPNANFAAAPLQSCAGNLIQFSDFSTGPITDWLWQFGDGGQSSEQNPKYQYTDTGYFPVTLIVSEYGCKDTLVRKKYVYLKPPVARFDYVNYCSKPYAFNFVDSSISAETWLWTFGDGQTDNTPSPQHTYTDTGTYPISLKVTNGACSYIKYDTIQVVDENPSFSYKPMQTNFCKYDSIQFFATNYNPLNIKSFYWDFNDGNTQGPDINADTLYHYYSSAGNYLPQLVVKDIHNCLDTVDAQVTMNIYGPAAAFSNINGTCPSHLISFTDASASDGTNAITKWIWDYGDGSKADTLTASPFTHSYSKTGKYSVFLKVIDANGCYDTINNVDAVEITQPIAGFFADSLSCSGSILQFSDSSVGDELNYNWNFGDGSAASSIPSPQHMYAAEGLYSVKLIVNDKNGCVDTLTKPSYIKVSDPVSSFILTDTSFSCPPASISPQNSSQNFSAVSWNFGDGNTSSELNPVHYYTTAGIYDVKLTVQGYGASCFNTFTKKLFLKGPSAQISYNPFSGCNPLNVSLSAKAKNAIQFIWDFGNGVTQTSTDSVANYTYTSTGRFLPKLIVVDSGGCRVPIVNQDTVVVYGANAKFIAQPGPNFCDSININFIDSSTALFDNINSYKWDFGDTSSSALQSPSHIYFNSNIYHPNLTITTGRGCVSTYTDSLNIAIVNSPEITATLPDSACIFSPVTLIADVNNYPPSEISWLWNFGNGDTTNTQNATYAYTSAGNFLVNIIARNSAGCADTAKNSVLISPLPPVDAGADSVICMGSKTVLNASGAQSYMWLPDPSISCTGCNNPDVNPLFTTRYFVTGKSNAGCVATDSVTVEVKRPSKVVITGPDSLCIGNTIELSAAGEEVYKWQPENLVTPTSGSQTSSAPSATTVYSVIGTDTKGCFSDTAYKTVTVFPYPKIQIADSLVTIISGENYQINVIGSEDVVSWQWTPVNGLSCISCAQPLATPKKTTTYTVQAKNIGGCITEKNITITVLCKNQILFMPNTFSPNNDGMNDYFYPRGKGFTIKSFRIFSRWGNLVFEQNNFVPNNQSYGWNGMYKGKALQPDVYVFLLEVICDNGEVFASKGNITLLR
jgi:gliding motility-associated-like protein